MGDSRPSLQTEAPDVDREDRERRFAAGERICIGCGLLTAATFGGLCIDCDVKEEAGQ